MKTYGDAEEIVSREDVEKQAESWYEARRRGITATDIAAILGTGLGDETPFSVYWRKLTGVQKAQNKYMKRGHVFEGTTRDLTYNRLKEELGEVNVPIKLAKPGLLRNRYAPGWLCSPDSVVHVEDVGWRPLEIKTTAKWEGFGSDGSSDIPLAYRLQLLWQMMVIGTDVGYCGVLMPSHEVYLYTIMPEPGEFEVIHQKAAQFWQEHVLTEQPPPIVGTGAEVDVLKEVYKPVPDTAVTIPMSLTDELRHLRSQANDYAKLAKKKEAEIRAALGTANYGTDEDGKTLVTRKLGESHYKATEARITRTDSLILPRRKSE